MPVTVHLTEDYREPTVIPIFHTIRSVERSVDMTMRWENGRIRLFQCTPPPYAPPPPPPPSVDIGAELVAFGSSVSEGVREFFGGAERIAGNAAQALRRFFA